MVNGVNDNRVNQNIYVVCSQLFDGVKRGLLWHLKNLIISGGSLTEGERDSGGVSCRASNG